MTGRVPDTPPVDPAAASVCQPKMLLRTPALPGALLALQGLAEAKGGIGTAA